ncbi:hypothetical protein ACCO45_001409 [Purpureocillium lilacinum]|uniref:Uncharacterized protein n=1 Tax=Purpureocillium lilacinum TaxID=33203 RepID=A0ACC4E6Y7_PURLI
MDTSQAMPGPKSARPETPASPKVTVDHAEESGSTTSLPTSLSEPERPALRGFASPLRHHKRTPSAHREIKETLDARVEFTSDESDGRTYHRINQYVIMEEIGRGSYGAVHLATDHLGNEFAVKDESKDALFLIREEIAIMKKLDHPNLVQLIEVLDDPEEDSLYMVLEMCKKGVVMKVGLDEDADPYSSESCRYWFRDLILGIEYLHAQGVIHRDIKPDNLLLSSDEVLKVVDFGVSEMFEKPEDMKTAKSAGSPAFLPPELCGKHKEVSGKAADIWSMGVSLYCLKYGRIPFNRPGVLEIYEAIKEEDPKDPEKRITMAELREHAWVTKDGSDLLLSAEENCAHLVEAPNELEINRAFTRKMNHLLSVMKAIHRFRSLLIDIRSRSGALPGPSTSSPGPGTSPLVAGPAEQRAEAEEIEALIQQRRDLLSQEDDEADKGHARDVADQEPLFLGIGTGARDAFAMDEATPDVVADSPTAVDFNVYDRAYEEAVEKQMKANKAGKPTLYLTKFVKETEQFKKLENLVEGTVLSPPVLKAEVRESKEHLQRHIANAPSGKLAQLVSKIGISDTQAPKTRPPE